MGAPIDPPGISPYDLVAQPVLVFVGDEVQPNAAGEPFVAPDGRFECAPGVALALTELVDLDRPVRFCAPDVPPRVFEAHTRRAAETAVVTLVDVSDRQAREDAECLLEWQSELSGAGAWEVDLVAGTVAWSDQVKRIHDVEPDFTPSIEGAIDFYAPEAQPVMQAAVEKAIATGEGFDLELPLVTARQRRIWVRAVGRPHFDKGACIRLRGTFQDITERRLHHGQLQSALDQARDFQRVFDTAPTMQCIADHEGKFIYVNPYWSKVLGWSEEELCSGPFIQFVHPDDVERTIEESKAMASDRPEVVSFSNRYRTVDGDYRWLRWYAVSDLAAQKIYAVAIDITAERQREAELQRLASVANRTENGVLVTGPTGLVDWVNPAFERSVGYELEELVGRTPGSVLQGPDSDREVVREIRASMEAQEGFRAELVNYRKNGERFWTQIDAQPVFDDDGQLLQYVAIQTDVTERKQAEDFLKQATDEAQRAAKAAAEASQAKSQFLANMSHEIRTPLNGVIGMADLLRAREDDPEQSSLVETIRDSGQVLLSLVNDILDFSKIEAGHLALEATPMDLADTVRTVVGVSQIGATQKGLALTVELPDLLPHVLGDAGRVRQILTNLVSNAVKFTESGHVRVAVRAAPTEDHHLEIAVDVEDSGPGIADDVLPRLFRPFTQADASTTRRFGGTGLGLSISRSLAEKMGGTLGVTSTVGEGSCFTLALRLPVAAVEVPSPPTGPATPSEGQVSASVLVVEDNAINQRVAAHMLRRIGCRVTLASDGAAGFEWARTGRFDLVLMDCQMPHVDGFEATRRIRALEGPERDVPIIALTANSMEGDRQRCLEAGMNDYLAKPIRAEDLAEKVRSHLPGMDVADAADAV